MDMDPDPTPKPNGGGDMVTLPGTMDAPTLEVGNGQLTANWTPPEDNGGEITMYELHHSDDGGSSWSGLIEIPAPAVSTDIMGLTNGSTYVVQVRARNSAGAGDWSESSVGATPIVVSLAPNGFMLAVSMQTITATWTAPTDTGDSAIIRYELQHREVGAGAWEPAIATADADTLTLTIPNLTKGTEYEVRVYAVNAEGNGNPTEIMKITIPATVPSAPNAPTLTGGNARITATWTAPDDGGSAITSYEVQYSSDSGSNWTPVTDAIGTATSYTITGLTNGTSYDLRVRAVNAIGTGGWSASATETTPIIGTRVPFGTPVSVILSAAIDDAIANAENPSVTLAGVTSGTSVTLPTVDSSTGVITVTAGTTAGTYVVSSVDGGGNELFSAEKFYVTVSPHDGDGSTGDANTDGGNDELDAAVAAGITAWGNTANLNYIITTAVTDMDSVFISSAFTGNISGWDVSKVTNMGWMFNEARAFNGDISAWDVSKVTTMSSMFSQATAFNGNISGWDVSKVKSMTWMFYQARAFNGNISGWDVSKVTNMFRMFNLASAFNQNLEEWKEHWSLAAGTLDADGTYTGNKTRMFAGSGLDSGDTTDPETAATQPDYPSWYW
ncbi:MAG: BspA family leucine-rich repeat surface protein [Salinispira sp.]